MGLTPVTRCSFWDAKNDRVCGST